VTRIDEDQSFPLALSLSLSLLRYAIPRLLCIYHRASVCHTSIHWVALNATWCGSQASLPTHKGRDDDAATLQRPTPTRTRRAKGWGRASIIDRAIQAGSPSADVNTCSRRYSHERIDFLTRLLRVINPTRGRRYWIADKPGADIGYPRARRLHEPLIVNA